MINDRKAVCVGYVDGIHPRGPVAQMVDVGDFDGIGEPIASPAQRERAFAIIEQSLSREQDQKDRLTREIYDREPPSRWWRLPSRKVATRRLG